MTQPSAPGFFLAAIGALALAESASAVSAYGNIPFSEPGVIHACRAPLGGILRKINSGNCLSNEEVGRWNIPGPAGPQGPQGLPGEEGPIGPQGIQG